MIPAPVWVALGGALGSILRYAVTLWAEPISQFLPWGTVAVNIAGSFLIGFFGTLTLEDGRFPASANMRLFVMVGICGGFTTFSSFSLQTFDLLRSGEPGWAAVHAALSVLLCLGAIASGHGISSRLSLGGSGVVESAVEEEAS